MLIYRVVHKSPGSLDGEGVGEGAYLFLHVITLKIFPFLKERVFQTENICLSVCPTNHEAAFLYERGKVDFRFNTDRD